MTPRIAAISQSIGGKRSIICTLQTSRKFLRLRRGVALFSRVFTKGLVTLPRQMQMSKTMMILIADIYCQHPVAAFSDLLSPIISKNHLKNRAFYVKVSALESSESFLAFLSDLAQSNRSFLVSLSQLW